MSILRPLLFATAALTVLAAGCTGSDDSEEVRALRERVAELEDQIAELEATTTTIAPDGDTTDTTDGAGSPDGEGSDDGLTDGDRPSGPAITARTRIDLRGIGPIEAGMTLAEAEEAAGMRFVVGELETFGGFCYFAHLEGLPDLVFLVVSPGDEPVSDPLDGVVGRVTTTVHDDTIWQTVSGIAPGDTETEVYNTYGADRIISEPHAYIEGGHYLTFVPDDPEDQQFRVRFFTDGRIIQEIHAGDAQVTGYIEGCA